MVVDGDPKVLPGQKPVRTKLEVYFWAFKPQQRWKAHRVNKKKREKKLAQPNKNTQAKVCTHSRQENSIFCFLLLWEGSVSFSSKRILFLKCLWERRIVWIESLRCCITESHRKCTMQMTICLIRCLNRVHCLNIAIIGDGWTLRDFTIKLKNFSVTVSLREQ